MTSPSENARARSPFVFAKLSPVVPSEVYDTYWRFACERQAIFFRRLEQPLGQWTKDPILSAYKFTNTYRASDRVSQFLIRRVIHEGDPAPREVFFRTLLFKLFNRVDTWELLARTFGGVSFREYRFERYDALLSKTMEQGERLYSAAYIMPAAPGYPGPRKHSTHLRLLERMVRDEVPERLVDCRFMRDAFAMLRAYPMMGDFLAYQYVTDLNYSSVTTFDEMEFVVPGPGARDGIRKCFRSLGGLAEADVIRLVAERQELEFERLGLAFRSLWGRHLQLIDCQNVFCEVDKYARLAHPDVLGRSGRTRIKQTYSPKLDPIPYWYPPKWGLNERIALKGAHGA